MANKQFDGIEQPSWYDGKMIDEIAFCGSFLHTEAVQLAAVLGFEIVWRKRGNR